MRLVDPRSDHYRIFRHLFEDKAFSDPAHFPCVLPPVAILDTPYNFSFVAMPMYAKITSRRAPQSIYRFCSSISGGDRLQQPAYCDNRMLHRRVPGGPYVRLRAKESKHLQMHLCPAKAHLRCYHRLSKVVCPCIRGHLA